MHLHGRINRNKTLCLYESSLERIMVRTSIEKPIMSDIASNTVIPIPPYKLGVRLVQKLEKEKYCMITILSRFLK